MFKIMLPLKVELRKTLISDGVIVGTFSKFPLHICKSDGDISLISLTNVSVSVFVSVSLVSFSVSLVYDENEALS
jgi:hypothetical protein